MANAIGVILSVAKNLSIFFAAEIRNESCAPFRMT